MAGKVAKIDAILNPDNLAQKLSALYSNWKVQRNIKESEWQELRNYLFATDTTKTTNSKLPWKNKTTLPKLTQLRDNLHANYMDALFPNDDWLKWEGYSKDDVIDTKRKAIEAYMKNKLRSSGFRETISKLVYDYIDYGNPFAEARWVKESHIDPITKEEEVTYIGPKAFRISPFDIVFNPIAPSFKESPKFVRYLKSIGELKKDSEEQPTLYYDQSVIDKAINFRKQISGLKQDDINKAMAITIDGFGSLSEYYQSDLVEILEFEGDIYDSISGELLENRIITIIDRCYTLRNIENPSWFGSDSKVHVAWRERSDNIYGMGPLDNLVGLQYRIDHLENLKADALDLTIHPPLKIKGDVEPFTWGPGVPIYIPEDGDVEHMPPNAAAFQVNNEISYLLITMEEMAGAPKEAMGIRTPGEKTAFEVQQLQNASGRIFQNKTNKFEIEFMEPLINSMLELAKRNLDMPDIVKVMDDDVGVVEFLNVTKDDITAKGKLRPIGARHYAARAQLMQNLLGLFNSPVGKIISPHVSAIALAKLVEEQMGFEQYKFIKNNVAIFEQADTQRLANQAQATVQNEQATPVEENMM